MRYEYDIIQGSILSGSMVKSDDDDDDDDNDKATTMITYYVIKCNN